MILLEQVRVPVDGVDGVEHGLQPLDASVVDFVAASDSLILGLLVHGEEATWKKGTFIISKMRS